MTRAAVDILLVEDNSTDAELITEALKDSQIPHRLKLATDGEEAMRQLRSRRRNPHLVLLDLNLPKMNGVEVLKAMRCDARLCTIPVIILTNSDNQDDVSRCYSNGCNAYIRKPLGFDGLIDLFEQLGRFWFNTATLPSSVPSSVVAAVTIPPAAKRSKRKAKSKPRAKAKRKSKKA